MAITINYTATCRITLTDGTVLNRTIRNWVAVEKPGDFEPAVMRDLYESEADEVPVLHVKVFTITMERARA